jgi:hypothetical protein
MFSEESRPSKNGLLYWNMLDGGIVLKACGNYGSTQYDPFNDYEFLEAYICDDCLIAHGDRIRRLKKKGRRKNAYKYTGTFTDYQKENKKN